MEGFITYEAIYLVSFNPLLSAFRTSVSRIDLVSPEQDLACNC